MDLFFAFLSNDVCHDIHTVYIFKNMFECVWMCEVELRKTHHRRERASAMDRTEK